MAYLNSRILDLGLNVLTGEATDLMICSAEPASFAAVAGLTLGAKSALDIGAPQDAVSGGRKVVVAAIEDGDVTSSGTPTHWAIVDTAASRLLAAGPMGSAQAVTVGNTFTLPAFDIELAGLGG